MIMNWKDSAGVVHIERYGSAMGRIKGVAFMCELENRSTYPIHETIEKPTCGECIRAVKYAVIVAKVMNFKEPTPTKSSV